MRFFPPQFTLFLLSLSAPLFLNSCGHMFMKKETYAQKSAPAVINGAEISPAVNPQEAEGAMSFSAMVYMAGRATMKGPFKWRIQAKGKTDQHISMTVHRLKVLTSTTKREEWFPQKYLGRSVAFTPIPKEKGESFAAFELPGLLEVYPEKDGNITVIAEVSVKTKSKSERRLVRFQMNPSREKETDSFFLPTEIIKNWKPDPRDWSF